VRLEATPSGPAVSAWGTWPAEGIEALVGFCRPATRVAVDAPAGPSRGAHLLDSAVAAKFRPGRCSEIPVPGVPAVPWVTPLTGASCPGWMLTGFDVWDGLRSIGVEAVETFPAAVFHLLNGGRWPPPKTTPAGRERRLALLQSRLVLPGAASGWGHDLIDATAAALVAACGRPQPHSCPDPDGSALWLV
jgi:predicted nuclease with RNAse H fold